MVFHFILGSAIFLLPENIQKNLKMFRKLFFFENRYIEQNITFKLKLIHAIS